MKEKICKHCGKKIRNGWISRKYHKECAEQVMKAQQKHWRDKNQDKIKIRRQTEKYKARRKAKLQTSKEKLRRKLKRQTPAEKDYHIKYIQERLKTDPIFCLAFTLRKQLRMRLKLYSKNGKTKHSSEYGVDYNKIAKYLKPTNKKTKDYHVDHIIPVSHFDLNNELEIKLCFSPENLQWLSGPENNRKYNNIRKEDVAELQRRINEEDDKLDVSVLTQLIKLTPTKNEN